MHSSLCLLLPRTKCLLEFSLIIASEGMRQMISIRTGLNFSKECSYFSLFLPGEPARPTSSPNADPYGFPSPPSATSAGSTPQSASSSIPPYPTLPSDTSVPTTPQPYNPPSTPNTTTPLVDYSSSLNSTGKFSYFVN